jgi:carbamoyltransferase
MLLGINADNHDASMALIDQGKILWAAHSERYSRVKNDSIINRQMVDEMLSYGTPKTIVFSDRPFLKSTRKLFSGERPILSNYKDILTSVGLGHIKREYVGHHKSHAAAGYFTSKFDDASILVVDSIGEWSTVSIWEANGNKLKKVIDCSYPNSIGLFYSAMTQYVGLKPNEEEYILMGMAAYGRPILVDKMLKTFFDGVRPPFVKLKHNLHKGCLWWEEGKTANNFDIAASAQFIVEHYLTCTARWMKYKLKSNNLVFMGGVALNCVANSLLAKIYPNIHIMPNPGDAGNSIGACAALLEQKLKWDGPYLGTDIDRELDIDAIVKCLQRGEVVGVANGRAEFGPRALGNRSLLCDPRGADSKHRMNTVKMRQGFRPFAPAILAEHASKYFNMNKQSPYMQFVFKCKDQKAFPGICHADGTSRVQTVTNHNNMKFRELLEAWYSATGCPMLLNTSLNIRGQPLVNSWNDAVKFQETYSIKVF